MRLIKRQVPSLCPGPFWRYRHVDMSHLRGESCHCGMGQACALSQRLQQCLEEERRAVCDFGFSIMQQVPTGPTRQHAVLLLELLLSSCQLAAFVCSDSADAAWHRGCCAGEEAGDDAQGVVHGKDQNLTQQVLRNSSAYLSRQTCMEEHLRHHAP